MAGSELNAMLADVIDSESGKSIDPSTLSEYVVASLRMTSTSLSPLLKLVMLAPLASGVRTINITRKSAIFVRRFSLAMVSPSTGVSTLD